MRQTLEMMMAQMKPKLEKREYACSKCCDTGYIETIVNGYEYSKECECLKAKREQEKQAKYIAESGLESVLNSMSFETYNGMDKYSQNLKTKATEYLKEYQDYWWYVSGRSGCGKTHITTAICGELIKQGIPIHYMQWRDESTEIKAVVNNSEQYNDRMRRLKRVKVLYIDDFFKGAVTEADVKLAFEILNARYNSKLPTLLSSERSINEIIEIDEAIGGRINQMAGKYNLNIKMIGNRRIENE